MSNRELFMEKTEVILKFDSGSLERIETFAKKEGKTLEAAAAFLLEKGIDIEEEAEKRQAPGAI